MVEATADKTSSDGTDGISFPLILAAPASGSEVSHCAAFARNDEQKTMPAQAKNPLERIYRRCHRFHYTVNR